MECTCNKQCGCCKKNWVRSLIWAVAVVLLVYSKLCMKESTLVEMQRKVETLAALNQQIIGELTSLKDLALGLMELVKGLPGYEAALASLKAQAEQAKAEEGKPKLDLDN